MEKNRTNIYKLACIILFLILLCVSIFYYINYIGEKAFLAGIEEGKSQTLTSISSYVNETGGITIKLKSGETLELSNNNDVLAIQKETHEQTIKDIIDIGKKDGTVTLSYENKTYIAYVFSEEEHRRAPPFLNPEFAQNSESPMKDLLGLN